MRTEPDAALVPERSSVRAELQRLIQRYHGRLAAAGVLQPTMKITLLSEVALRLEATNGPMTIEAASAEQLYSPFHMLASGLAFCVHSALVSWAGQAKLAATALSVEVGWTFADDPHRVGSYLLRLIWPGLPEARVKAAGRAASLCTVHATLAHPPQIAVEVRR